MKTPSCALVGLVGINGFARTHFRELLKLRNAGSIAGIIAVAHAPEKDPAWFATMREPGVEMVRDLDVLLDQGPRLALITLPVGFHLHVPMSLCILDTGIPIYLEKPVAGCLVDFERLARNRHAHLVQVGLQHLALLGIRNLRSRIAAGTWGAQKRITVTCGWSRGNDYYQRNSWAGKITHDGHVIRGSPLNNSNAHYTNLALSFGGGTVKDVDGLLLRVNPIQSFDTCGLTIRLDTKAGIITNASYLGQSDLLTRFLREFESQTIQCFDLERIPFCLTSTSDSLQVGGKAEFVAYRWALEPVCTLAESRAHVEEVERMQSLPIQILPYCAVASTRRWHRHRRRSARGRSPAAGHDHPRSSGRGFPSVRYPVNSMPHPTISGVGFTHLHMIFMTKGFCSTAERILGSGTRILTSARSSQGPGRPENGRRSLRVLRSDRSAPLRNHSRRHGSVKKSPTPVRMS